MKNMIIEMYNKASADTDDRSVLVVREGGMSVLDKINRQIALLLLIIAFCQTLALEKWDIWMSDAKRDFAYD